MVLNAFFIELFWNRAITDLGHECFDGSLDLIRALVMPLFCFNLNDTFRPEIESLLAKGLPHQLIAKCYHTTEANLHNWLKKHGMKMTKEIIRRELNIKTRRCELLNIIQVYAFSQLKIL